MSNSLELTYPGEKQERGIRIWVFILGFLFFLNCFSPLRLHYDMLRYFSIKDCIESVCPPNADPNDYMPYGYTGLLLLLSKLGILRSFTIVFVNCLYLFGSLYFVRKIFDFIKIPYFLFLLVLLNWTTIKFVTHALSEMQYLFFSLASVYSFRLFVRKKSIWNLFLSFLLAGLAFLTRTVGIALVAGLIFALIWEYRQQLILLLRKNKIGVIALLIVVATVLAFSKQLGLNHYTGVMSKQFDEGLKFSDVLGWHFSEWGEILMNTSKLKVVSFLPGQTGIWLFLTLGILGVAGFIYLCFIRKNNVPFVVKSYLLFYMLLMFNWPFADPRFWVPVIPLIAAVLFQSDIWTLPIAKIAGRLYFLAYALLGLFSLGFITYTSFNKIEFAKTQAAGVYRNEYEIHFFGKTVTDPASAVDSNLVIFLNKYDK